MDPSVQVAIVGVVSTVVTTGGVITVALLTARRDDEERESDTHEEALIAREDAIAARDEIIADLRHQLMVCEDKVARAEAETERTTKLLRLIEGQVGE